MDWHTPHLVADDFFEPRDYEFLCRLLLDQKPNDTVTIDKSSYNLSRRVLCSQHKDSDIRRIFLTYLPPLVSCLAQLAPERLPKLSTIDLDLSVTNKDHEYSVHTDIPDKLLSVVIYMHPKEGVGTLLYDTEQRLTDTVPWKQNRALIFSRTEESWHSYRGNGRHHRYTANLFLQGAEA